MHACIRLSFSHYYTFIILQLFETFAFFFHWLYLLYLFFIKKIIYLYKWEQRGKKALGKALCLLNIYFFSLLLLISFREKTNSNPIITFSLVNKCISIFFKEKNKMKGAIIKQSITKWFHHLSHQTIFSAMGRIVLCPSVSSHLLLLFFLSLSFFFLPFSFSLTLNLKLTSIN